MATYPILELKLAKVFSRTPGPRFIVEGDFSGEQFRSEFLIHWLKKAIAEGMKLRVDLDGTAGCGTSFLEESFGGLIRYHGYTLADIIKYVEIKSDEMPNYKENIESEYLPEAEEERSGKKI
jgi:hypothetical protein